MTSIKVGQQWPGDPRDLTLTGYEGTPEDLAALTQVRNETLRAITPPEDFREWGPEEMDRFYNRGDFNLEGNAWLMLHAGRPVAAGVVYPRAFFLDRPPGNFDLYVAPEYARLGLGTRLLAHLERAAEGRGHQTLETTVAREDEPSTRFLRERGFQVVGQSARLSRHGLDDLPDVDMPQGYTLRTLAEMGGDPDLYRETTNRLGSYDTNYSLLTEPELEALVAGEVWEPEGVFFLLEGEERITGVIRASGARTGKGHLHEIRVQAASRGKGLGVAMVTRALSYLRDAGVGRVTLDTKGENTAAHNLAVRCGFEVTAHWLHFLKQLHHQADSSNDPY
jgi:GNAT superfamily N-acetyltransferase